MIYICIKYLLNSSIYDFANVYSRIHHWRENEISNKDPNLMHKIAELHCLAYRVRYASLSSV